MENRIPVSIYLTTKQKEVIEGIAKDAGLSISQLLRDSAIDYLKMYQDEWLVKAQENGMELHEFLDTAVKIFLNQKQPMKSDNHEEIEILRKEIAKLEAENFRLRNVEPAKAERPWELVDLVSKVERYIIEARGKFVSPTKLMTEFGLTDPMLFQQICAKLTEHGFEYNTKGFRDARQMRF